MPSSSNFNLISAIKKPSLIILSNKNNSVEFLIDLANEIMSLIIIDFVEISKSSTENSLMINDFKDIFVFIFLISSFLPSINIVGFLVVIFAVKLKGFSKNLISFKSKLIFVLIFRILSVIFSLNLSVFIPIKLK